MAERLFASLPTGSVTSLSPEDRRRSLRVIEAIVFAAGGPVPEDFLATRLPEGSDVPGLLKELQQAYAGRGVHLCRIAGGWTFRTADDLTYLLSHEVVEPRKLSRAAMETLAIVAYHQPVTRADIEEIRGVAVSGGTLDMLLATGWVRMRGRRRSPGRPITYGTTAAFLEHFGFGTLRDLPGLDELRGAGFLQGAMAGSVTVPRPGDLGDALGADEDPLEDDAADDGGPPDGRA